MTDKTKAELIVKVALGEIAALGGTTLEYIERLDKGKDLFNAAIGGARESYYQEEVNKNE